MKQFILYLVLSLQSLAHAQTNNINIAPTFSSTTCESIELTLETLEKSQDLLERFQTKYESLAEDHPRKETYKKLVDNQARVVDLTLERLQLYSAMEAARIGFQVSEQVVIPADFLQSEIGRWEFHTGVPNTDGDVLLEVGWSHAAAVYGAEGCRYYKTTGSVEKSVQKAFKELIQESKNTEF